MLKSALNILQPVRLQSTAAPIANVLASTTANNPEPVVPINVQALYHAPLKIPVTHGDLVASVQLRSYDNENLDFFADFSLRAGFYLGIPLTGPKPLPTRRERWTVIKSPFVHAKSKENFERHTHKRLIKVWDTNPELVELWISYITKHSITGVGMKCSVFQRAPVTIDNENYDISDELANYEAEREVSSEGDPGATLVNEKILELLNTDEFKKHM
ncbi:mitochondrial 37S ribosomal protein uS10m NDAI_0A05670 [Naumovozyma dairenensis CBS 421]|uniref:Small ribosomal subunit protein uS10m n=1 Tax=Naumovozyma dairenensis (strain ATCC 10597 / BCRC 20456 / CBS 421 / NBRC 0211 / NRRL Y-12639) TaxID=1071378 RepID=G0W4I4_NAUDC|nr:hypothetical protein NDAI_0A05670 [Naumovozyma dairenensis CBS 421]CCD22722.1 hypothetical protein NDAI_0A05670 [Naumovozyma dairenensis CBS 421]